MASSVTIEDLGNQLRHRIENEDIPILLIGESPNLSLTHSLAFQRNSLKNLWASTEVKVLHKDRQPILDEIKKRGRISPGERSHSHMDTSCRVKPSFRPSVP